MSRVSKKEDQFYEMFQVLSAKILSASDCYFDIISTYPEHMDRLEEMKQYETDCDKMLSRIFEHLSESFITPFDREDISSLILKMDDVVDGMENVSRRYELFHVNTNPPEATEMARLANEACHCMDTLFQHFHDFRRDPVVMEEAGKIHKIEDEGDAVFHDALARLFDEKDPVPTHLLKWNTIYNKQEEILDSCKTVAALVGNVVLKNA